MRIINAALILRLIFILVSFFAIIFFHFLAERTLNLGNTLCRKRRGRRIYFFVFFPFKSVVTKLGKEKLGGLKKGRAKKQIFAREYFGCV